VEESGFAEWRSHFERCQLELWLAGDMLRTASNWADNVLDDRLIQDKPEGELTQLAMARVLIVKGDERSLARALEHLSHLREGAEETGRMGIVVEALALQALALWRRGDSAGALGALERALRLAEPEGYLRLFADIGLAMARLLQEARARDVMPAYVADACWRRLTAALCLPRACRPCQSLSRRASRRCLSCSPPGYPTGRLARSWLSRQRRSRSTRAASTESWASPAVLEAVTRAREIDLLE
jgi:hypothetical protein